MDVRSSPQHATLHHCARGLIQGVSNGMSLGAVVCNDGVHGETNGKVEDIAIWKAEMGRKMPDNQHAEDKDHGAWSQSGTSDLTQILRPSVKMFCYYDCIGHFG